MENSGDREEMIVRRIILAAMVVIILLSAPVVQAGLIGDYYQNERFGCSLNGNGWTADVSGRKKLVIFKNQDDGISEVSLEALPLTALSATSARDVAVSRIEAYDSWIYVGGRPMEGWEIGNANATDGFIAMYNKNIFNKTSGTIKLIVTEKYFIKGGYAYIVTMLSSSSTWYEAKDRLLKIAGSFKLT